MTGKLKYCLSSSCSLMSYPLHFTLWVVFNGQDIFSGAAEKCGNHACLHVLLPPLFSRKMKSLNLLNPKMVSLFSQLFVLLMTRHYHSDSFSGSQGWVPCAGASHSVLTYTWALCDFGWMGQLLPARFAKPVKQKKMGRIWHCVLGSCIPSAEQSPWRCSLLSFNLA